MEKRESRRGQGRSQKFGTHLQESLKKGESGLTFGGGGRGEILKNSLSIGTGSAGKESSQKNKRGKRRRESSKKVETLTGKIEKKNTKKELGEKHKKTSGRRGHYRENVLGKRS